MNPQSVAKRKISFAINGQPKSVHAHAMDRLLDVLRRELALTGTKEGCGEGECGACSVLLDGILVNSCLIPVAQVEGASVTTIEGAAADQRFARLQAAFLEAGGAQCGICTPGMMLASLQLLQRKPNPTVDDIREALSGNICRCTGYLQIFESVAKAASQTAAA